jgi:transcriptional regulator, gntR family with lacI sensor
MDGNELLYEKILQYLKNKIENKELLPGDRLPTEMELAEEFGVSRITSKRALEELRAAGLIYRVRGRGSFVSGQTRTDNAAPKANAVLDYSKVVAFMIPFSCANGGIMDTVKGASKVLSENGYILDVKYSNSRPEEEKELLESLYEKNLGGIIFYPISDRKNLELMNMFSLDEYPIVSIDKYFESVPISCVVSDNQKGEYEATKYLLGLGHRNIAFLSDAKIEDATSVRNRYFGYCKALKESGLPIRQEFVKNGDFYNLLREPALPILKELLEAGVTAMCCINDYVAVFIVKCLEALGVKVPEEVSVIGFDNVDVGIFAGLTTVRQNMEYMGECAARYIVECNTMGKHEYIKTVIPVEMICRESCAEARKA